MARNCGVTGCGMKGGLFNPFFQPENNSPYGLLSELLAQTGNSSTDIKLKLSYIGNPATKGNWNIASAYSAGELRAYPINSPIMWRVKTDQSVLAGENPPISNSKWELALGVDMIQNMGSGKWARTTLQRDEGEWIKMGPVELGTYAGTTFSYNPTIAPNYTGNGSTIISTSTTSISIPTTHPSSRTITIGTGLTIPNSTAIGSCTDSFSIPTTHPSTMTRTLPTGLTLSVGDTISFYGDANNFFVFVVARYNSGTGSCYGFSVAHVGTGSFSSWTLKTEKLRRVYRTANQTGQYMVVLVQTYNSGTGSLSFNTIKNVGTGTVSDWTLALVREANDPASAQTNNFNYLDVEAVGCWFVITATGSSFGHKCIKDNRGTGWRYIYASGPLINSPPADVVIDTYNASSVTNQLLTTFDNIEVGTHTFIAVSETSASGLSANTRAWVYASTNSANIQSLNQAYNYDTFTADFAVMGQGQSNGEFAFRFRENADAGDTLQWMPYHGQFTMSSTIVFTVNNVIVSHTSDFTTGLNPYALKYTAFTTLVLTQNGNINHPQAATSLGTYTSIHTFNASGADFICTFNWTVATFRSIGYANMLFLTKAFGKKIKFNETEAVYTAPQSSDPDVVINTNDLNPGSVLVHSDSTGSSGEANYAFANYSIDSLTWTSALINNYDATYNKLYPTTHSSSVISPGTTEIIRSKWYLGNRGST